MTVYLTSDTHFLHARILELSKRPFHSLADHDEVLISNHNAVVHHDDTLIHFGDLCLGPFQESLAKTRRLMGRRFLIPGNHDRVSSVFDRGKAVERFRPIYEDAGWTVLPEHVELELQGVRFLASHYPYQGDTRENDRYVGIRPHDYGLPLLHGHIHTLRHIDGRMFNVGVDVNDFAPVHEDAVVAWASGLAPLGQRAQRALASRPDEMAFFDVATGELR